MQSILADTVAWFSLSGAKGSRVLIAFWSAWKIWRAYHRWVPSHVLLLLILQSYLPLRIFNVKSQPKDLTPSFTSANTVTPCKQNAKEVRRTNFALGNRAAVYCNPTSHWAPCKSFHSGTSFSSFYDSKIHVPEYVLKLSRDLSPFRTNTNWVKRKISNTMQLFGSKWRKQLNAKRNVQPIISKYFYRWADRET